MLLLIRGIIGSGKSTLAKQISKESNMIHIESDMFLYKKGEYKFCRGAAVNAHSKCFKAVSENLKKGISVVVSNCFTNLVFIRPYEELANKLNIPFLVMEAKGDFPNDHGFSQSVIDIQKSEWEVYYPLEDEISPGIIKDI